MGYVSIKAIQGCMCVGYYDLVCVCDDENYFKHRNNLLEMTQTMQDKLDKNEHFFEDKLPEDKKPCACTTSDGVQHSKISPRAATLPDSSYEGSLVVHPRIKAKEFEYADKNEGFEVTTAEKGLITAIPKTNIVCQYDMNSVKCTAFQTESDLVNKATRRSEPISKYVVKGTSTSPLPLGYTRSVKVEAISQDTKNTSEVYRDIQDKLKALEYVCQEQKDNIKNFQKEQAALERQIQETTRSDQQRETCGALANKVKILERRLAKYSDIAAKDLETSKNNSLLIDNMLAEREEVQKKMEQINELETQLVEYKKKATKAEELRGQLRMLQKENSPYYDTKKIQSRCVVLESELESVTAERDALQKKFGKSLLQIISKQSKNLILFNQYLFYF
ncbi:uncharacterized protein LOC130451568 [Diorhabda sublineata]|uniref:uncharacterized protein LOC130451568 n=1 Tax=Diorhabda sublineata TaxID=1163346 RepID=UPI0024E179EA|nr:uncharacterized protein LOC130451568 [Diorhabda sublineata]